MAIDNITLAAAKSYIKSSLANAGALKGKDGKDGKNVYISSIAPITNGNRITFSYTLDDGTEKTSTLDVMNGKDGKDLEGMLSFNEDGDLIVTINGISKTFVAKENIPTLDCGGAN